MSVSQNENSVTKDVTKGKEEARPAGMQRRTMKQNCVESQKNWVVMCIVTVTRGRANSTPKLPSPLLNVSEESTMKT